MKNLKLRELSFTDPSMQENENNVLSLVFLCKHQILLILSWQNHEILAWIAKFTKSSCKYHKTLERGFYYHKEYDNKNSLTIYT